jgi:hypothetical protein
MARLEAGYGISLDTICNAANYFALEWTPDTLKGNQCRDVLRLIISKLYGAGNGNLFHAQIRATHQSLADKLLLSREWTCKMVGRLRETRWLKTIALRLPDGKQEVTLFRPGKMLKRLLVMLMRSSQRPRRSSRVNDPSQTFPKKEEGEKKPLLSPHERKRRMLLLLKEDEERQNKPPTDQKIASHPILGRWIERGNTEE